MSSSQIFAWLILVYIRNVWEFWCKQEFSYKVNFFRKHNPRFAVLRKWGRKTEIEEYWRVHLSSLSLQLNTRNRDSNPRKSDWKHVPRKAQLSSCDSNLMIMMMLMWLLPWSPSLLITLELGRYCIIVHWS